MARYTKPDIWGDPHSLVTLAWQVTGHDGKDSDILGLYETQAEAEVEAAYFEQQYTYDAVHVNLITVRYPYGSNPFGPC